MEDWLASYKDDSRYNLGESGMPDITVARLLELSGESMDSLANIVLKDHDTRGTERLRRAICDSYDGDVPFKNICVATGTSEALFILFNLLLGAGKSAVVPMPSFQALYDVPKATGAELRPYRVDSGNSFKPEADAICCLIDSTTGVVVINSPHNPSGVILPQKTVDAVIECADHHGATVISDEHYRYLPLDESAPLKTHYCSDAPIIATGSITKCFGLIGLRVGWIAAPESLIERFRDYRDYLTHTLSPVSDYLAAIALENRADFLDDHIQLLRKNRQTLVDMVAVTPGLSMETPEGGIVAFPRYEYEISTEDFVRGLVDRHGVFVLPGSGFETERAFRVNLGQVADAFSEAMGYIHEYCLSLHS